MLERIHHSKVIGIMERRVNGRPLEFSIQYCKKSTGELVFYPAAVLSSVHSKGATINILVKGEDKPRTLRKCLITYLNGMKVYF